VRKFAYATPQAELNVHLGELLDQR